MLAGLQQQARNAPQALTTLIARGDPVRAGVCCPDQAKGLLGGGQLLAAAPRGRGGVGVAAVARGAAASEADEEGPGLAGLARLVHCIAAQLQEGHVAALGCVYGALVGGRGRGLHALAPKGPCLGRQRITEGMMPASNGAPSSG